MQFMDLFTTIFKKVLTVRLAMKLIRLASLTFIACVISISISNPSSFATNYFVKNGGSDSADGKSDATAWKTIAKVNAFAKTPGFKNGDTINLKRGCTWSNDETLGYDGSSYINWGEINGLIIQDYGSGDLPLLNGNTQRPIMIIDSDTSATGITNLTIKNIDVSGGAWWSSRWFEGNIRIANCANLTFDGIYFDGHKGSTDNGPVGALYIGVPHGNVEIKNCEIKNGIGIGGTLGKWGSIDCHGIMLIWTANATPTGPKTSGTINIHDNIIHDFEGDCIQLMGVKTNTNIYNNKMYHFGENALDFKTCNHATIYNNEFYRGDYGLGGSGGGTGSIVFHDENLGSCENIVIRDNQFHTSDYIGIRLLHGANVDIYRNYFKNITNAIQMVNNKRVNIYNNVFDLAEGTYSASALDAGIYVYPSSQLDSNIYNNTFYLGRNHRYGIYITKSGVSVRNNIFYCVRNNSDAWPLRVVDSAAPTVEYNCYYNPNHTNRVNWNGVVYNSSKLQQFRNDIDSGAIFSDPIFKNVNTGDFSLQSSSPCILPSGIKLGVLDAAFAADFLTTQQPSASLCVPSGFRIAR